MKKKILIPTTPQEAFAEAETFYQNAKETLTKSPVEFGAYKKTKYVKEASAMGYLAALKAIDGYLLSKGVSPKSLPTSITEYGDALGKLPQNDRLLIALTIVYQNLHIFGYYRGGVSVEMIKAGFSQARLLIEVLKKISNKKTGS